MRKDNDNNAPLSGASKALFDCFAPSDPLGQLANLNALTCQLSAPQVVQPLPNPAGSGSVAQMMREGGL